MQHTRRTSDATAGVSSEFGDWYRYPLWYDILHTPGTAEEVDGLERIAERFVRTDRRGGRRAWWLEPGCGTGRYLRVAAGRGRGVIGVDALPEMIAFARERFARRGLTRRAELVEADMARFETRRRADFAFCLINTFRHLHSDDAALEHLASVDRALRPGGVYALGLNITRYGLESDTEDTWDARRGSCAVTQVVQYLPPGMREDDGPRPEQARRETVINHLVVTTPSEERHLDSVYDLRCYSPREWWELIERSPFRIEAVVDETGRDLAEPEPDGPVEDIPGGYALYILRPRSDAG